MAIRRVTNPPNPWQTRNVEYLEQDQAPVTVFEERARSIVSENRSPDVGFRYSINPYRGCYHACAYCYARPTHEYLDFGAGSDFEQKIVVKTNAVELLETQFEKRSWPGELVVFSGVTDCYQPLEASYGLTRGLLEVCHRYRNPVGVITKGSLVKRDRDVLAALHRDASVSVYLSIPFADPSMARAIEPTAPGPDARFAAMRSLAEAGIPVGLSLSPLIPGLNEDQIPEIVERAAAAGASRAFRITLRLPGSVRRVFSERLREAAPLKYDRVMSRLDEVREGTLGGKGFGERFRGHGDRWNTVEQLFQLSCRRHGLRVTEESHAHVDPETPSTFRRPFEQGELFPGS